MTQFISVDAVRARVKARQVFSWQEVLILLECKAARCKVGQISEALGVPKPSVTRAIDNLEALAKPFLRRREDAKDLRSPWIEITADGSRFLNNLIAEN